MWLLLLLLSLGQTILVRLVRVGEVMVMWGVVGVAIFSQKQGGHEIYKSNP